MTAVRQDAWTPDDDLILAEITLRHIREGSTQLSAFEEVGQRIGRTAAACGFRWNSCVRKKYEAAIQIAKGQRQKRNQTKKIESPSTVSTIDTTNTEPVVVKGETPNLEQAISIESVIRFLRQWKTTYQELTQQIKFLEKELQKKEDILMEITSENEQIKREVTEVQSDYRTVNDDYKALIQIMDRARKMAFLAAEEEDASKPKFKMDANGNLERID
ncbi:RsfA family transcriptional regulator [Chengkuizengella axinellae]|uniref:RsfA family transcriptional regulator n=1 Tax=Chengkuizengella axinellae TaxID=3064388 RepID=A0ABT9IUW8_9BACL|nr:RsfA family transcriptional regulator [Chengkuizengella sp. 2205SS18-9]MDP5273140.1 RsfA family transcriptional regulator [Chengkuizengella sp. 2205SS18-9]